MNRLTQCLATRLALLLMVCLLPACDSAEQEGSASSISGYNYTNEGIQSFYVNGQWGGAISIGGGGGSYGCCVTLPQKMKPGLSAKVTWVRSDCQGDRIKRCPRGTGGNGWAQDKTLEATVPIERYERAYTTYVAFLPNDEVKIYVTLEGLGNPNHPAKLGRPRPLDHPEWKPYQP
jgi:hypothetical protein